MNQSAIATSSFIVGRIETLGRPETIASVNGIGSEVFGPMFSSCRPDMYFLLPTGVLGPVSVSFLNPWPMKAGVQFGMFENGDRTTVAPAHTSGRCCRRLWFDRGTRAWLGVVAHDRKMRAPWVLLILGECYFARPAPCLCLWLTTLPRPSYSLVVVEAE